MESQNSLASCQILTPCSAYVRIVCAFLLAQAEIAVLSQRLLFISSFPYFFFLTEDLKIGSLPKINADPPWSKHVIGAILEIYLLPFDSLLFATF